MEKVSVNSGRVESPTPIPYLELVLGFSYGVYVLEQYLSFRQYRRFQERQRSKELITVVEEDEFLRSQAYNSDKSRFQFVQDAFGQLQMTLVLLLGALPLWWKVVGDSMTKYTGLDETYVITQSILFVFSLSLINSIINLPFSLYGTFVVEERHGFNKQTLGLFFTDFVKSILLSALIGPPVLASVLKIIDWGGEYFYYYVWAFMVIFQLVMMTIYPTLIQPLFNKVTPLQEGSLRSKIEALASKIAFPLTRLYVIDGSRRSSHSNAYFYGFFKNKRIVLFDTLLEQSDEEEVCAVLGHELGHWALNHTVKHLIVAEVHLLGVFYLFSLCYRDLNLYQSFGFAQDGKMPVVIGFLLFNYIFSPIESLTVLGMNILSRKHEFEADAFAKKLGYAAELRSGLIKLQTKNLSSMAPDPWYSAYHYSHPPLTERLSALEKTE